MAILGDRSRDSQRVAAVATWDLAWQTLGTGNNYRRFQITQQRAMIAITAVDGSGTPLEMVPGAISGPVPYRNAVALIGVLIDRFGTWITKFAISAANGL